MRKGEQQYQFRVNGLVMPYLRIQNEIDGASADRRQIAVEDARIGWVVLDDNEDLADSALSKFVLEVRDFMAPSERRLLPNRGLAKGQHVGSAESSRSCWDHHRRMNKPITISKSRFIAGCQCLKRLYWQVREPELLRA